MIKRQVRLKFKNATIPFSLPSRTRVECAHDPEKSQVQTFQLPLFSSSLNCVFFLSFQVHYSSDIISGQPMNYVVDP
jgi:hypothetical protein